jgi:molecular chaperone GrpE
MENRNKKETPSKPLFNVADRRFWQETIENKHTLGESGENAVYPTFVENLLKQLEVKENRLQEAARQIQLIREEATESKKRLERNMEKELNSMKAGFFRSFVDIIDNVDRSILYAREINAEFEQFLDGVLRIQSQLKEKLKEHQVVAMELAGKKFDPNWEEAIDIIHTENKNEEELILSVHQQGYMLGDFVIRPARVSVGKYVGMSACRPSMPSISPPK